MPSYNINSTVTAVPAATFDLFFKTSPHGFQNGVISSKFFLQTISVFYVRSKSKMYKKRPRKVWAIHQRTQCGTSFSRFYFGQLWKALKISKISQKDHKSDLWINRCVATTQKNTAVWILKTFFHKTLPAFRNFSHAVCLNWANSRILWTSSNSFFMYLSVRLTYRSFVHSRCTHYSGPPKCCTPIPTQVANLRRSSHTLPDHNYAESCPRGPKYKPTVYYCRTP